MRRCDNETIRRTLLLLIVSRSDCLIVLPPPYDLPHARSRPVLCGQVFAQTPSAPRRISSSFSPTTRATPTWAFLARRESRLRTSIGSRPRDARSRIFTCRSRSARRRAAGCSRGVIRIGSVFTARSGLPRNMAWRRARSRSRRCSSAALRDRHGGEMASRFAAAVSADPSRIR